MGTHLFKARGSTFRTSKSTISSSPGGWWYKITEGILEDLPGRSPCLVATWAVTLRNQETIQQLSDGLHMSVFAFKARFEDENETKCSAHQVEIRHVSKTNLYSVVCQYAEFSIVMGLGQKVFKLELTQEQSRHLQQCWAFVCVAIISHSFRLPLDDGDCDDDYDCDDDDLTPTMAK